MGDLNSIQDVIDYLGGSTVFWVIAGIAVLVAAGSLLRGAER